MNDESYKLWRDFCESFDNAVFKCAEERISARLVISIGGHPVCVDVYPQGGTMKKFDKMILEQVKKETGISVVEE